MYTMGLKEDFIKPSIHPDFFDVYHIYTIRHPARDEVRKYLMKHDIHTEIHYPIPPYRQAAIVNEFKSQAYPVSDEIHATTLSLPISYIHTEEDVRFVIEVLNNF